MNNLNGTLSSIQQQSHAMPPLSTATQPPLPYSSQSSMEQTSTTITTTSPTASSVNSLDTSINDITHEEKCMIAQEASLVIHGYKKRLQHQLRMANSLTNTLNCQVKTRSASYQSNRSNSIDSNRSFNEDSVNVNIKTESNSPSTISTSNDDNSNKYQKQRKGLAYLPTQISYDLNNNEDEECFVNSNEHLQKVRQILSLLLDILLYNGLFSHRPFNGNLRFIGHKLIMPEYHYDLTFKILKAVFYY